MEFSLDVVALGLIWFVVFLFSVTVHEAAHAWAALRLGDETAYHGGQVTLNPLPHILREPLGTIIVPIISYAMMGWMMGWASAPYDPHWADRHPRRAAWMAAAGPASNLLVAVFAGIAIRVGLGQGFFQLPVNLEITRLVDAGAGAPGMAGVATFLSVLFTLNLLLFAFNLIPLPPLDGAAMMPLVMSEDMARRFQDFMRQPGFGLLGLILAWRLFGYVFWPLMDFALGLVYPG